MLEVYQTLLEIPVTPRLPVSFHCGVPCDMNELNEKTLRPRGAKGFSVTMNGHTEKLPAIIVDATAIEPPGRLVLFPRITEGDQ